MAKKRTKKKATRKKTARKKATRKKATRKKTARKKATRKKAARKKTTRKKTTRKKAKRSAPSAGEKIQLVEIGRVHAIEYKRGGQILRHEFKAGSKLGRTHDGRFLIVAGKYYGSGKHIKG